LLVKERFGKVDVLINNAVHGTWICDIMDEKSIEVFEKVINVNIKYVDPVTFVHLLMLNYVEVPI
jgi:NAD(P)-dependent dehydrogenase (short-subunit alcohol dehydrogenase family)